jgi:hypothetical protein
MAAMVGVTEEMLKDRMQELMESGKLGEAIAQANAAMAAQAATVGEEIRFDPATPVAEVAEDTVKDETEVDPVPETPIPPAIAERFQARKAKREADAINPSHYQGFSNGAEVIDITENLNFNRGNAVKYAARAGAKNPDTLLEDLRKAKWYLEREIARVEQAGA